MRKNHEKLSKSGPNKGNQIKIVQKCATFGKNIVCKPKKN